MDLFVRTCNTERMNVARLIARLMLIVGAALWVVMMVSGSTQQRYANLTYSFGDVMTAGLSALLPIAIAAVVFLLALFYERIAAIALFVASVGVVIWGVVAQWSAGVWGSMLLVMVLPILVAATLLLIAANTQRVCETEERTGAGRPTVAAH